MKTRPISAVHRDTSITNKISKNAICQDFLPFHFWFPNFPWMSSPCEKMNSSQRVKMVICYMRRRAEQQRRVWSLTVWLSQQAFQSAHYDWSEKKRTITHSRLLLMSTCWIKSRLWNQNCYPERRRAHTEAKSDSFPGKHRPARAPATQEWSRKKEVKTPRGMSAFTLPVVQLPLAFNFLSSKHLWCASLSRAYLLWH